MYKYHANTFTPYQRVDPMFTVLMYDPMSSCVTCVVRFLRRCHGYVIISVHICICIVSCHTESFPPLSKHIFLIWT